MSAGVAVAVICGCPRSNGVCPRTRALEENLVARRTRCYSEHATAPNSTSASQHVSERLQSPSFTNCDTKPRRDPK